MNQDDLATKCTAFFRALDPADIDALFGGQMGRVVRGHIAVALDAADEAARAVPSDKGGSVE
jgi:hypothetical protein